MMAGPLVVALLAVLAFVATFLKIGLVPKARQALSTARDGVAALTSTTLDENAKEKAVQQAGLRLLGLGGALLWRLAVLVGAALVPIQLASLLGLVPFASSMAVLLNGWFILGTTLALLGVAWAYAKTTGGQASGNKAQQGYSAAEQVIHMVAFIPALQRALMKIDTKRFLRRHTFRNPKVIIVTSIARGGTTTCLNALYSLDNVATTTYRDMPFITAPWLWSKCSGLLNRKTSTRERAHGDGLKIALDSPEAFDEVLWKLLWPKKYAPDGIGLWHSDDADADHRARLQAHIEKIAAIRGDCDTYVSKNNANLARLAVLPKLFPDCQIVVPIRHPAAHAASLLRQHENFVSQQRADPFVKRYMEDIGHFEFGLAHRPILFAGFAPERFPADSPDYWLAYWITAFRHVQAQRPRLGSRLMLVTQDDLRSAPDRTIRIILERSGVECPQDADFSAFFRAEPDRADTSPFSPELLAEALELYADLTRGD